MPKFKFIFIFKTLLRNETVEHTYNELVNTDLQHYADHLLLLQKEGATSATFQMPAYGKVSVEIVE